VDAPDRMPAMRSGETTGELGLAGRRRWLVQTDAGELHLVDGETELRDLVRRQQVTFRSRLYEVSFASRTVADVLAVARPLPSEPDSEPPVRADTRSLERIRLSEELALLDRPLEDEVEYYDEVPRSRAKAVLGVAAVLALLGGGAYKLLPQHLHLLRSIDVARAPDGDTSATARAAASAPVRTPAPAAVAPPQSTPALPRVEEPQRAAQPTGPDPSETDSAAAAAPSQKVAAEPAVRSVDQTGSRRSYDQLISAADRLLENGRRQHAEELYEKALAARSGGAEALTGLGYCELDRGRASKAVSLFKQALAHHPSHGPALFGLGEAYREQGLRAMAVQSFKRYLAVSPAGRDADVARRQLRQLGS
jgi:tetratricopeptide (TPR) repeat protein